MPAIKWLAGRARSYRYQLFFLWFMEKLAIIETTERWKLIRELRNAVNHEYEEDAERLT